MGDLNMVVPFERKAGGLVDKSNQIKECIIWLRNFRRKSFFRE